MDQPLNRQLSKHCRENRNYGCRYGERNCFYIRKDCRYTVCWALTPPVLVKVEEVTFDNLAESLGSHHVSVKNSWDNPQGK